MNKYHNKKIIIDDYKFDSIKEGNYYKYLKLIEKQGEISNLKLQPKFELQPKFKKNDKTYRAINYIADFAYYDIKLDEHIVIDVKGFKTKEYLIKKKLFEYKYPQFELQEICK